MPMPPKPARNTYAIQSLDKDRAAREYIARSDDGAAAVPELPEPEPKPMMIRGISAALKRRIEAEARRKSVTASAIIRMTLLEHLPPEDDSP